MVPVSQPKTNPILVAALAQHLHDAIANSLQTPARNGGDDGTRTRGLGRDSSLLEKTPSDSE